MLEDKVLRGALIVSLVTHGGLFATGHPLWGFTTVKELHDPEIIYFAPPSPQTTVIITKQVPEASSQGLAQYPVKTPVERTRPAPKKPKAEVKSQSKVEKPPAVIEIPIPDDLPSQFVPIFVDYYKAVRARILRYLDYPNSARTQKIGGDVWLAFDLDRQGRLRALKLQRSGIHELLNGAALQSIRAASPFPAFPSNLPQERITFNVQIEFQLD
ncbi:MAG: energy transducer TonB [Candidatus Omnitrophica bacterium]|nr:energy transducer TonB [Candidatus Omnitrophota bacterium]